MRDPTPDWVKSENASVTDPMLLKVARWIAQMAGVDDLQGQVLGLMGGMVPKGQETMGPLGEAVERLVSKGKGAIKAFHGSPHDFDKFDTSKIGTGEGAQAYGHGLYFAEKEGTAKAYRDALGGSLPDGWAQKYPESARGYIRGVVGDIMSGKLTPEQGAKHVANANSPMRQYPSDQLAAELADGARLAKGRMYEVAIDADPDQFLDWDAPLSQQSEHVQKAVGKAAKSTKYEIVDKSLQNRPNFLIKVDGQVVGSSNTREQAIANAEEMIESWSDPQETGQALYKQAAGFYAPGGPTSQLPSQVQASQRLKEAGIPGIKYLDSGSRAAGEGSRNYVVFDDRLVSILKKYGIALPVIEALRQRSQQQGGKLPAADVQQVIEQ
jgi:hypothetical protein